MNRTGKAVVLAALAVVIYSAYTVYQGTRGFNPASIDRVKDEIRADFAAKNFDVVDVTMLRRGPRELAGSVKLKAQGSDQIQQKNCTAAIAADMVTTSWKCD